MSVCRVVCSFGYRRSAGTVPRAIVPVEGGADGQVVDMYYVDMLTAARAFVERIAVSSCRACGLVFSPCVSPIAFACPYSCLYFYTPRPPPSNIPVSSALCRHSNTWRNTLQLHAKIVRQRALMKFGMSTDIVYWHEKLVAVHKEIAKETGPKPCTKVFVTFEKEASQRRCLQQMTTGTCRFLFLFLFLFLVSLSCFFSFSLFICLLRFPPSFRFVLAW